MSGFIKSFFPIFKRLKKFKTELVLISVAILIAIFSLVLFVHDSPNEEDYGEDFSGNVLSAVSSRIVVDIAGAVEHPGVYETTSGARLKDILIQAGGLSADAERDYIARNFNLAKLVIDQEKVYVPSSVELSLGIFTEPQKVLDYTSPITSSNLTSPSSSDEKISINAGIMEELDTLPGVGKITAEKIIKNRPYKSVEELSSRKILKKNVYENIKNLISL